jgi:glycosyltransferase involved in cell wall biosynthesis
MNELKKQVDKLGLREQVLFTGNVSFLDVKDYMALFSVGVMPKYNGYGSPVKIFEYGAMGLPVIAPNNGPVNDVMLNSETGLLGNGLTALIKQIVWVNEHMEDAKQMANSWIKIATKYCTFTAITKNNFR